MDYFTIDKDGNLLFDDMADSEVIKRLLEHIYDEGFDIDQSHTEENDAEENTEDEISGICISMPRSLFTDANPENLNGIIASKGSLIKKALGIEATVIEIGEDKVSFPWFTTIPTADEMVVFETFIRKLCEMARRQKRITATAKEVDNEKYAFRCFLLRLGFIGKEYKGMRKILLRNLFGSSAFRSGNPKEVEICE